MIIQTKDGQVTVLRSNVDTVLKVIPAAKKDDGKDAGEPAKKVVEVAEDVEPEIDEQKMVLFKDMIKDVVEKKDAGEKAVLMDRIAQAGDDVAPYLYVAFNDTPDKNTRRAILDVLARAKNEENLRVLTAILKELAVMPQDRVLRVLFTRDLARKPEKANVTALVRMTRMSDGFISKQAAMALRSIHKNDPQSGVKDAVVAEIEFTTKKEKDKQGELATMVKLLATVGDASVLDLLLDLSKSYTPSLRTTSVWSLAKLFPQVESTIQRSQRDRVWKRLVKGLQDRSEQVRAEAARAFAATGDRLVIPDLIVMLEDRSAMVRSAAHEALKTIVGTDVGNTRQVWQHWWNKQQKTEGAGP